MPEHPVSQGALCSKGNAALEVVHHQERLCHPLRRRGDGWVRISWDEALDIVAEGISGTIRMHGPDAVGFLSSSKCTNEENYLIQKMARSLGSPNVDNCARLCHAPSVVGLNRALGSAGMTNPISDLVNSRCIFIIGSNLAENHPVIARWIHRAKERGALVIVADPRITQTAWLADIFLQIIPGTDLALLSGMANVIVEEGMANGDFIQRWTEGYEALKEAIREFTPSRAEEVTGVPAGDIIRAARAYARSPASTILYSMGITQHSTGTDNVQAIANLALICGQIGRPGAGIMPLRGQNNVQGACDMGCLSEFYPGYRRADDPDSVRLFEAAWGVGCLPARRGLTAMEMIDAAFTGSLRAMYIVGEDPVNSDPSGHHTREALERLDLLVVQDIFMTATAQMADLVLPAAAWAEKEGSYTSTERRVQWSCRAVPPPGEARSDLEIVSMVSKRLGLDLCRPDAASVLSEISRLVPQYGGITRERLAGHGLVWPCPDLAHPGTPILHANGFSRRANIVPVSYRPVDPAGPDYPLVLTTGRVAVHHNAGSMTRRSPSLVSLEPEPFLEISNADASGLGISDGEWVTVSTRLGSTDARARLTDRVREGVVFMSFHFPGTNQITADLRDPEAGIPQFKVSSCRVTRRD